MTSVKISRTMYFLVIINILWDKAIGATSSVMARAVGQDTWISMSIGFIAGALVMIVMAYLSSQFPGKTIVQITGELWGRASGVIIGILLIGFFITAFGVCANVLIIHASAYFLPQTPFIVLCLIFTLLCIYAVYLGIEVIARYAFFGIVSIILMDALMMLGGIEDFNLINLLPLMDRGLLADIASSIYIFGDVALAVLAAGFLYPILDSREKSISLSFWAMVAGGVVVLVWPVFEAAVIGPEVMGRYVLCCMEQARATELTRYFPRFEIIMVSLFTAGCVVQSAVMAYCAKAAIRQVVRTDKDSYVIIWLALILVVVTYFIGVDNNHYSEFLVYPWAQISSALGIGLPSLLLLTAWIRGKLKHREAVMSTENRCTGRL